MERSQKAGNDGKQGPQDRWQVFLRLKFELNWTSDEFVQAVKLIQKYFQLPNRV